MKRVYKRQQEPELLKSYRLKHPDATWDKFRRRFTRGYRQVKQAIIEDQHGLCAYCEISIKRKEDYTEVDDFRVEHFFPKGATQDGGHNYHLDWRNLLGVCHGGSQKDVPDAEWRFSEKKGDRSCDVPKGGKEITDRILNPLKLPGNIRLFRYTEHNGKMYVDEETCPDELKWKAKNTIKELNLNAPRLMRMRKAVIDKLTDELMLALAEGQDFDETLEWLAESFLLPDHKNRSIPFFTVIRWYLGDAAEKLIASSGTKL